MNDQSTGGTVAISLRAIAVGFLIGFSTWLVIYLTRPAGGVTIIWLASGLLAGILLTSPYRVWPAYIATAFVASLVARAAYGDPPLLVAGRGIASTIEVCIVVYALRYFVGDVSDPAKLRLVARIAITSTLIACAVSAFIAATTAVLGGASFASTYASWFVSHMLGMVVFATVVGIVRELGTSAFGRPGHRGKFARSMGLLAAAALWVFSQSKYSALFLIYPPLLLVVFRHHFAGLATGITLVVVAALLATKAGTGPLLRIADPVQRTLMLQIFIAITCLTTLPVAIMLAERGRLAAKLRDSERNYRLLADHSRDLVVRLRADGHRLYVSPSSKTMLGWEPGELSEPRWDLVHPEDRAKLGESIKTLLSTGSPAAIQYRVRHKDGHYVWIEALAERVPGAAPGDPPEIVYSGRDISRRVAAELDLAENQQRVHAIADNLPAMVIHVDAEQRYTFVNAYFSKIFGVEPGSIIGRQMREFVDEKLYAAIRPYLERALRGERVTFEGEIEVKGQRYFRQANYIPDFAADGSVRGFYSMTYDITELQAAKQELLHLAQHDTLTGLANRNKFNERLSLALAKSRRSQHGVALIYLDIDYFKQINDTSGHAVGDAVLREFAARLRANVRETDLAARLGGDEFAVLIEDVDSMDVPDVIARKLLESMRRKFVVHSTELCVTASIGIGSCRGEATADSLLLSADQGLYAAKAAGRNTYRRCALGE